MGADGEVSRLKGIVAAQKAALAEAAEKEDAAKEASAKAVVEALIKERYARFLEERRLMKMCAMRNLHCRGWNKLKMG